MRVFRLSAPAIAVDAADAGDLSHIGG